MSDNRIETEAFLQRVSERTWGAFAAAWRVYVASGAIVVLLSVVTVGLAAPCLVAGLVELCRRRLRGEPAAASVVFSGFSAWMTATITGLVIVAAAAAGLVLLVVPGLLVIVAAAFAFHFIVYENARSGAAIAGSIGLLRREPLSVSLLCLGLGILNLVASAVLLLSLLTVPLTVLTLTVAFEELQRVDLAEETVPGVRELPPPVPVVAAAQRA